jgi:hypothetical protein
VQHQGGNGDASIKGGCGHAGDGIRSDDSLINVRGSPSHVIQGGSGACSPGFALYGDGITWSGVSVVGSTSGVHVEPPEP